MDVQEIKKTLEVFKTDNGLHEVRVINMLNQHENYSAIFDNDEDLIREVGRFDREPYNLYFIFNELKDATRGLIQLNRFIKGAKTIKDQNIKYLRWLMIDLDAIREGGVKDISSTNEEFQKTHLKAIDVYKYLKEIGFTDPVVCQSGNGYHIMYRLNNVEATEENAKYIKDFFYYMSMRFTDEYVDFDTQNSNAARLTKMYSTTARKGGNTTDRPHRISKVIKVPDNIIPNDFSLIVEYANKYRSITRENPNQENRSNTTSYNSIKESFNIDDFLRSHNIVVAKEVRQGSGRKIILKECPFHPEHGEDSAIFVSESGAIGFKCFHNGCDGKQWQDVRLKFDPHAYDKKEYEPKQFRQPYIPERKKYKIQDENPELGKKWLSLSDVKAVNLSETKTIKTGFRELDKKLLGLNLGEVTLLSGSNSAGKSSWLNTLILNVINNGNKVALWSGELPPDKLKMWIHNAAAGKSNIVSKQRGEFTIYETPPQVGARIDQWLDGNLFLYNNEYSSKWEQIFNDINELLKLDVNLFILDNLFSMDIDIFDGDKNNKQKELILQICQLAKKNKIHIILVAHPRKAMGFLRKTDISGTADLTNAVDNVFICHRVNNDFVKTGSEFLGAAKVQEYSMFGNCIEVCKNRMFGVVDYLVGMYYEIESRRFKNTMDEQVIYKWQEQPQQVSLPYADNNDYMPFEESTDEAPF